MKSKKQQSETSKKGLMERLGEVIKRNPIKSAVLGAVLGGTYLGSWKNVGGLPFLDARLPAGEHYGIHLAINTELEPSTHFHGIIISGYEKANGASIDGLNVAVVRSTSNSETTGANLTGYARADNVKTTGLDFNLAKLGKKSGTTGVNFALISEEETAKMLGLDLRVYSGDKDSTKFGMQVYVLGWDKQVQSQGVNVSVLNWNTKGTYSGLEAGLLANLGSQEINGIQIAIIANNSRKVNGVQLALGGNFADSTSPDVTQVGIVNLVDKFTSCSGDQYGGPWEAHETKRGRFGCQNYIAEK